MMKRPILIVSLLLLGQTAILARGKQERPKVSMEQAQKIALDKEPGTIQSKELEKEHGKLIYSFDIRAGNGSIHEVNVDAMTGAVMADKVETAEDEAKEKQQELKKARKKTQQPE